MPPLTDYTKSPSFKALPILDADPLPPPRLDLAVIRQKLATAQGRDYWRGLEELAQTEEFEDFLKHEFPRDVDVWDGPISRRTFLKLMGASLGLAFFSGCRKPLEMILPYNEQPENVIPGRPLFFASALSLNGYARGVLVESHMGRPTKIEGNPQHPDSLGATDAFMQSAILTLYDPDRSQVVTRDGAIDTWDEFFGRLRSEMRAQEEKQGAGLRILSETITSPTLLAQRAQLLKQFPQAQWHFYEPVTRESVRAGAQMAFGQAHEPIYRFDQADVILSLDADFLVQTPGSLQYARKFSERRRSDGPQPMNRLYVAEPTPTVTGGMADHRLPLRAGMIESLARQLALDLGVSGVEGKTSLANSAVDWISVVAKDLRNHRGSSLVIAGYSQPPAVHALAHAINQTLGNNGRTVLYSERPDEKPMSSADSLQDLVKEMNAGKVDLLLVLGGNPVYDAPADLNFAAALSQVKIKVRLGLYEDETSALCQWHLPQAHALESWGDLRAFDGTVSLIQPLIEPMYGGKTAYEIVSGMLFDSPRSSHDLVRDYWKTRAYKLDFEKAWRKSLNDGVIAETAFPIQAGSLKPLEPASSPSPAQGLEIVFKPDPSAWDGQFANNGWLQELPKPMSKLTWDNAALVSPALAQRLGLSQEDVIELRFQGRSLEAPVYILPGQAEESITLTLGYGRTRAGRLGTGLGTNAYLLRTSDSLWFGSGLSVRKTGKSYRLASTQHHYSMEGRDLIRAGTLAEFDKNPQFAKDKKDAPPPEESLFNYSKPKQSDEYAWGMGIDLNSCIGCNACVIACQAENNIPVVGKDQVLRGREMHWIRVDQYYNGDLDNPQSYHQPVPCMHCEDAPCEVVCPVGATVHSEEGLNEMVYNRCIGTRYCSNNCPYKVRRFNFYNYSEGIEGPLKLLQNPDVTVRSRGVMEKCTYCVQRIQSAKITSDKEGRAILDGEVTPACAQACPSQSIVFGNLLDKKSKVTAKKADPRDYALLGELGTRPRTSYQARLKNPNPDMKDA